MSDNCRYFYLKLKEDFFKDETILLLEDCKDGFMYSNILLKMYLLSLKHEGQLLLSEDIAYTPAMIATLTRHQIGTIEQALQLFIQLGLVEELTDGSLFMSNIQSMIGTTSSEAERKKKERSKLNRQKLISSGTDSEGERKRRARQEVRAQKYLCGQMSESIADICPPEIEKEIERERVRNRTNCSHSFGQI